MRGFTRLIMTARYACHGLYLVRMPFLLQSVNLNRKKRKLLNSSDWGARFKVLDRESRNISRAQSKHVQNISIYDITNNLFYDVGRDSPESRNNFGGEIQYISKLV